MHAHIYEHARIRMQAPPPHIQTHAHLEKMWHGRSPLKAEASLSLLCAKVRMRQQVWRVKGLKIIAPVFPSDGSAAQTQWPGPYD